MKRHTLLAILLAISTTLLCIVFVYANRQIRFSDENAQRALDLERELIQCQETAQEMQEMAEMEAAKARAALLEAVKQQSSKEQ